MKTEFNLSRGIICFNGKYLIIQREKNDVPYESEKWEIPGGRIKEGENPEKALFRTVEEETGLEVKLIRELSLLEKEDNEFKSRCHVYLLESSSDDVKLDEGHIDYKWINPEEFGNYPLALFAKLLGKYFNNPDEYLN